MDWKNKIAVANTGGNSISFIEPRLNIEEWRIQLDSGVGPCDLLKPRCTSSLLITQIYDNSLVCLNLDKGLVEKVLLAGCHPKFMAVCNITHNICVSNADSDSISIVGNKDNLRLVSQIPAGSMPQGIDCHPQLPVLAVANMNSQDVWFIDTRELTTIYMKRIDGYPTQVRFSRKGDILYVGCYLYNGCSRSKIIMLALDGYRVCGEIPIGCVPFQIVETGDGKHLLVISLASERIEVVNLVLGRVMGSIEIDGMAYSIALDGNEECAYVTNTKKGTVAVVDWRRGKKITDIRVDKEPSGIVYLYE
ncbi:MAG: YncE family protein [Clostridiales bacterium]|nr:YncE family protein [Clostridiales bacterium]